MYFYERNAPGLASNARFSGYGEPPNASPTTLPTYPPKPRPIFARFAIDSAVLDLDMTTRIGNLAQEIVSSWGSALPVRRVLLVGHTDETGTVPYNLALGRKRAEAVKAKLVAEIATRGRTLSSTIDQSLAIETDSRGKSQPITGIPARRGDNRRVETFLATAAIKQPPPPPPRPPEPPKPPRPITGQPPHYVPPIVVPPKIPWPNWRPPQPQPQGGVPPVNPWPQGQPPPSTPSGPGLSVPSWLKSALSVSATMLGIVYSGSMWAVEGITLQRAIDAAWLVFQLEEGGLKELVGLAGEKALEAVLPEVLGINPKYVLNLNSLSSSFPVLDIISARGLYSVKTYGIVSTQVGQELLDQVVSKYKQDFFKMVIDQTGAFANPMEKAVKLLYDNQDLLRAKGQWPSALRGRTEQAIRKYIQEEAQLVIPNDHVQPVRKALGKALNEMRLSGKLSGADPLWIQKQVFRIQGGGLESTDLSGIVETTQHLPKEQYERLHRENDAVIRARKRRQP